MNHSTRPTESVTTDGLSPVKSLVRGCDRPTPLISTEIAAYYHSRVPALQQNGPEWRGPCPIHNGSRDSFSVSADTGQWYCHSECLAGGSVFDLEKKLGGTPADVYQIVGRNTKREIVATYPYTDEEGTVLFEVVRYDPKDFRQRRPNGQGWTWNIKGVRLVPFRLPQVIAADTIFVAEGERDVATLEALGLVATCNPMGAGKWRAEYNRYFSGKHVVILPDQDEVGIEHGNNVARHLATVAASVCIVNVPGRKDVTEWGGTAEDLKRLVEAAPAYQPSAPPAPAPVPSADTAGFSLDETGVYHTSKGKEGNVLRVFVCGPLSVEAYARTTANDAWSVLLSFKNLDGVPHQLTLPAGSLETPGNKWLIDLLDAGLHVADKGLLKRYLQTRKVEKRMRLVDRIGWADDHRVFMLPSGPVPRLPGEEWVYKGNDKVLFGTKGTLDEWRANVAKYCVGNCRLTFAVSSAFLAPLLPLMGANEGRAFHYFHDSSSGKTTALQVAGSVCGGGGKLGFLQTWNSTLNAMECVAAAHNHCVLLLDELGEMDSRKAGQLAYVIVGGQGKARMNRNAEMRTALSWLNVVFSTGEISLERHMKATDSDARLMGGQEVRIISIPADTESGHGVFETLFGLNAAAFADMLKRVSNQYYGTALLAWLDALAARRDELVTRARKAADDFKARYASQAGPQVGRVAESFALVAAAGTLATEEGITGWPDGAAAEGAARCFEAWLKERGTEGSSDEASILKQVRRFYQLHGDSRFKKQAEESRTVINQAGYVVQDEFWTFDQVFASEVCKGFEPKQVARTLRKNGYLVTDGDKSTTKRTPQKGKRARFYVIRREAVFGEDQQLPLAA